MVEPERFLVELAPTEISYVEQISDDARSASRTLHEQGIRARFLRTVVVPEDGRCYLLWEAASREALIEGLELTGWEALRTSSTVRVRPPRT